MSAADHVISAAAQHYGWAVEDMTARKKPTSLALARHTAIFLLYKGIGMTKADIARRMQRDHSSIHSSLRTSAGMLEVDKAFKRAVDEIWRTAFDAYAPPMDTEGS